MHFTDLFAVLTSKGTGGEKAEEEGRTGFEFKPVYPGRPDPSHAVFCAVILCLAVAGTGRGVCPRDFGLTFSVDDLVPCVPHVL